MLVLTCPFCGDRDESEFVFGGPVRIPRPVAIDRPDSEWIAYLTVVPNPKGPVRERWWHAHGCGTWLVVERDTLTHRITSQEPVADGRF